VCICALRFSLGTKGFWINAQGFACQCSSEVAMDGTAVLPVLHLIVHTPACVRSRHVWLITHQSHIHKVSVTRTTHQPEDVPCSQQSLRCGPKAAFNFSAQMRSWGTWRTMGSILRPPTAMVGTCTNHVTMRPTMKSCCGPPQRRVIRHACAL